MEYINSPQFSGIPMDMYNANQNMPMYTQQMQQNPQVKNMVPKPVPYQPPEITMEGSGKKKHLFSVNKENSITIDDPSDFEVENRKRRKKSKSELPTSKKVEGIVKAKDEKSEKVDGVVEDTPTSYTYAETTGMLRETLGQIDAINRELVRQFDTVSHSRTMKNKYNVMIGLSENIGSGISNRIAAIREINNSITKSNDLDYKRYKDQKAAQSAMNDDKYIADLYKSFIANPQVNIQSPQVPQIDSSIFGSGIVRADLKDGNIAQGGQIDLGYLNYESNLTPEQNLMRYEGDPNVKQVVVYDASTGNKMFQMMNLATGQVIPNVPVYDEMFMADTTLDLKTKTAKNINLNETFPIVVINDDVTSQY